MSTVLLQCCNGAAQILKCSCDHVMETSCNDVQIAKAICCALISITAIVVIGSLIWRLIEVCHKSCQDKRKSNQEETEAKRKLKSDLIDKLLDSLKTKASEKSDKKDKKDKKSSSEIKPKTIDDICKLLEENAAKSCSEDLRQQYIGLCTELIANAEEKPQEQQPENTGEGEKNEPALKDNETIYLRCLCYLIELSQKDELNKFDRNELLKNCGIVTV